jgi:hypothetical protein
MSAKLSFSSITSSKFYLIENQTFSNFKHPFTPVWSAALSLREMIPKKL